MPARMSARIVILRWMSAREAIRAAGFFKISVRVSIREGILRWMSAGED